MIILGLALYDCHWLATSHMSKTAGEFIMSSPFETVPMDRPQLELRNSSVLLEQLTFWPICAHHGENNPNILPKSKNLLNLYC